MALQSALSRLRKSTTTNCSVSSSENILKSTNAVPAPPSVFRLDDTDKDLFSFSDDEFLNDDCISFCTPSVTSVSAGKSGGTSELSSRQNTTEWTDKSSKVIVDDIDDNARHLGEPFNHKLHKQISTGGSTSLYQNDKSIPTPSLHTPPNNPSTAAPKNSSAASSLERLRTFRFVKTPTMKGGTRRAQEDSSTLPTAKRRSVCDDVTNTGRNADEENEETSREHQQPPGSAGRNQFVMNQDHGLQLAGGAGRTDGVPPQDNGSEFSFLTDVERDAREGSRRATLTAESSSSAPSPSPFKVPPLRQPRAASTRNHVPKPHQIDSVSNKRTLPSASIPMKNSQPTLPPPATVIISQSQRTPQQTHLTDTNANTPSRGAAPRVSYASNAAFSTPKNRCPSRMPSASVTTPVLRTPSFAGRPGRRKFPGPAGLLPALVPGQSLDGVSIPPPSAPPTPSSTPRVQRFSRTRPPPELQPGSPQGISESCDSQDFSQGPWVSMMEDLDMSDPYSSALLRYNITMAIMQASHQQLRNGKVVHLRVLLKSVVPAGRSASAMLRDPTGEILCTLHRKVMEEHRSELQPGAALVLRQVSVFSPTPRKHYLNITPDNIVRIYPPSGSTTRSPLLLSELEERLSDRHSPKEQSSQGSFSVPHTAARDFSRRHLPESVQSSQNSYTRMPAQEHDSRLLDHAGSSTSQKALDDNLVMHMNADVFDQDWDSFDEPCNIQQPVRHGPAGSDVHAGAPSTPHEARESLFSNQLCDDEFDSLFSDIADNSFSF